jgi:multisubunit Na+/H+ antiporter MnhB subunit
MRDISSGPATSPGTAMQQAILTSSAIVAYVLLTQYGRRRFSWRTWLPAICRPQSAR